MDLRCQHLPTSLKPKLRTAAAPILRARCSAGARTVHRIACCHIPPPESQKNCAKSESALTAVVKHGATAALLGVTTSALVGAAPAFGIDTSTASYGGRSRAEQHNLERIIEERNGGQTLSSLLTLQQAKQDNPSFQPTSPRSSLSRPSTSPILQARLPYVPAPSLKTEPAAAISTAPAQVVGQSAPSDSVSQSDRLQPPSATSPAPSLSSGLRSVWKAPALPLQLAAIGTSLSADSGAFAEQLQSLVQPTVASISTGVAAGLDTITNGTSTESVQQDAARNLVNSGEALRPTAARISESASHLFQTLGDQMTVVLDKGAAVPATMALQMEHMADSVSSLSSGASHAAGGLISNFQGEVTHLTGVLGTGVHDMAANATRGATQVASLSISSLERLLGGSSLASEQIGMLASVLASSTALGTVSLASKRKLEAQNQELISQLERMSADYQSSLTSLKARIHDLQDSLAAVESKLAYTEHNFSTQLANTGLELTHVSELLQAEQEAQKRVSKERDELARHLQLARLEREQLTADADMIRQQLDEAHRQWSEQESQCVRLEEELKIAVAERLALRSVLEQLRESSQQQLSAAVAMEETYASRLGSVEQQVLELAQSLSTAEHKLSGTEEELQEVLEVNMELHESLEHQTTKHAEQLASLEHDWTVRINQMENKYVERLGDIEKDYETRLNETEDHLKETRAELQSVSQVASTSSEKLQLVEKQLQEVTAVRKELEDHQQQMERNYLEFEAETLATISTLKQELQTERQQHALLLSSTGEMQGLVAGLQSEKELLAEELEALRVSTSEQMRAALADSAALQQQNLRLETQLASIKKDCDALIAAAKAEAAEALSQAAAIKEEAARREQMALSQLEVTQEQLREAVTEGTKASMELAQMEKQFQEVAQQALDDNVHSQNKLVELSERYQAAMAQQEARLAENEQQIKARLEAEYTSQVETNQAAATAAQESMLKFQTEALSLKQEVEQLRESLTSQQENAAKLAAEVEAEKQLRVELEAKTNEATEVAAGLEKTYNIQLHFAERENARLLGLLEEEQAKVSQLSQTVEKLAAESEPAVHMLATVESERDTLRAEQEKLRLAMEEQAEMNRSLKARIAELECSKAETLANTAQQLEESKEQLQEVTQKLEEVSLSKEEQAALNASLKERIAELEASKDDSLTTSSAQLEEANRKLEEVTQQLQQVSHESELTAKAAESCNASLQQQVEELKKKLDEAMALKEGEESVVLKDLEGVRQEKEQLAAALQEEKAKQETLAQQFGQLQVSHAATMRALDDERRRSHKAVEEESGRSRSLQSQVVELQRRLERHSKMAVTTPKGGDNHTLHRKLSALERQQQEARAALGEERKTVAALKQQINAMHDSMDELNKENQELQAEKILNTRLKRRLSELQRNWGSDNDQERMLTLLKVEQTKAEEMERAALKAVREKRETEARLERQMQLAKERADEFEAQVKHLEEKLRKAEQEDEDDDEDGKGGPGSRKHLSEQIAQWKKDHEQMLQLAERTCSNRIEAMKAEYEEKIEQLEQQAQREAEVVHVLRSELQHRQLIADKNSAKAAQTSNSSEQSPSEAARLREELQRQARNAASAQEAAYIARCKLDEECKARMAVEELLRDLRQELQEVMTDVEKQNTAFFGSAFGRQTKRERRDSDGNNRNAGWAFA